MEQQTLFEKQGMDRPLASRMRPHTLEEFVGQEHLLGPGKILRQLIDQDRISSMIFWGPLGWERPLWHASLPGGHMPILLTSAQ